MQNNFSCKKEALTILLTFGYISFAELDPKFGKIFFNKSSKVLQIIRKNHGRQKKCSEIDLSFRKYEKSYEKFIDSNKVIVIYLKFHTKTGPE